MYNTVWCIIQEPNEIYEITLHTKRSFPLRISSVNATKSAGTCGFGHIYCRYP